MYAPLLRTRKLKVTKDVKMKQKISRLNPKAVLVAIYMYQVDVCVSWKLSNSFLSIACALYALIVDKPAKVAFRWVKTGDLAGIIFH